MFKRLCLCNGLLRLLLLGFICLACTGGTFTCESGDGDDDKVVVKGRSK